MTTTPIDNTSITTEFNVDELTEGTLTGKGVFDVLLQTLRLHLDREFNSNRITGTAYATVYSQAITAFLAQAAQYAINKAKLPLELQLLQEQIALTQKQQDQITAAIRQTDYVTDYQLTGEVANKAKQTELLAYELTNLKPVELSIAQQDLALKTAQADLVEYDLTTIKPQELALLQQQVATQLYTVQTRMPAEVANIQAETALKAYDLTDIKPTEKDNLISTGLNITAQTSNTEQNTLNLVKQGQLTDSQKVVADKQALSTEAQTSLLVYDLTDIKPVEKNNLINTGLRTEAETSLLAYDLTDIKPTEKGQIAAETSRITYTIQYQLPEEVELIKRNQIQTTAQTNLVNADTALKAYDLTDIKPNEKAQVIQQTSNLSSQQEQIEAETARTQYQTQYQIPEEVELIKRNQIQVTAQTAQIEAQSALLAYDLNNIKPVELANLGFTGLGITAETSKISYETEYKLPEEVELIKRNQSQVSAQVDEITYRSTTLLPSQTAQNTAQTAQITYTTSSVLPSQVSLTNAQTGSATAQTALYEQKTVTELAQTTTTPASGSVMGVQNDLMATQKASYLRDAEQKAAKMLIDTWNIRMNTHPTDTNFNATNRLSDADIGAVVDKMLDGIGVA